MWQEKPLFSIWVNHYLMYLSTFISMPVMTVRNLPQARTRIKFTTQLQTAARGHTFGKFVFQYPKSNFSPTCCNSGNSLHIFVICSESKLKEFNLSNSQKSEVFSDSQFGGRECFSVTFCDFGWWDRCIFRMKKLSSVPTALKKNIAIVNSGQRITQI